MSYTPDIIHRPEPVDKRTDITDDMAAKNPNYMKTTCLLRQNNLRSPPKNLVVTLFTPCTSKAKIHPDVYIKDKKLQIWKLKFGDHSDLQ